MTRRSPRAGPTRTSACNLNGVHAIVAAGGRPSIQSSQPVDSATIVLDETGLVEAASDAALELLGTTIDDLKAAPRGAFAARPTSADEDADLRTQWEAANRPDIAGETTIKRGDGREVRVHYLIAPRDEGGFVAILQPSGGPNGAPGTIFALGSVLAQWRAAERRLATISPDSPEWMAVSAEIASLRATYQSGYRARRRS